MQSSTNTGEKPILRAVLRFKNITPTKNCIYVVATWICSYNFGFFVMHAVTDLLGASEWQKHWTILNGREKNDARSLCSVDRVLKRVQWRSQEFSTGSA